MKEKPILRVMGAHNALGAKLIESSGFDGIWASGFEIATTHGVPDANILTMTENLEIASQMNSSSSLPVICDCDTGYGNAINVMHMVKRYEATGIAAVVIEDKLFPKVNSFIPGRQELASISEFCGKMSAARDAKIKSDEGMMIIARVEALIAGWGLEEALKRAVAYAEAGAEGIVIHSKSKTPDEVFAFAERWKKSDYVHVPLIAIPTTYHSVKAQELNQHGFKVAIYANQGLRTSVYAMSKSFDSILKNDRTSEIEQDIAPMSDLFKLQGMIEYKEDEEKYSKNSKEKLSLVIPAAGSHQSQPEICSIVKDTPLCMLRIGGKSILDHQLSLFRSLDVKRSIVITGYQKEKIQAQDIEVIENSLFDETSSAFSIMQGLQQVQGKTLVSYSDIVVDKNIAEELIQSNHPITIVIDRAYKTLPRRDKKLDLVVVEEDGARQSATRKLKINKFKEIKKIGKELPSQEATHEFIGLLFLNQEGLDNLRRLWSKAVKEIGKSPFYESESVQRASMTDLIQYAIDSGHPVRGLVIEHGWSEIYSQDDYHRLDQYFSEASKEALVSNP